jgi:type VI protein secretion system component Hcp
MSGHIIQVFLLSVLESVSIAEMKHHGKRQAGEESVYLAYTSTSLAFIEGSRDRNSSSTGSWRQELMQRPWRGAAY